MKRAYSLLIIGCIIAAVCGCSGGSDSPEGPKPTADLFPFTKGNSWIYLVEDYTVTTSGALELMRERSGRRGIGFFNIGSRVSTSQNDQPGVAELFMTCNGEIPAETSGWYEVGLAQNGTSKGTMYMKHEADGLLVATSDSYFEEGRFVVVDAYHRIRTPLEAGTEWEHEFADAVGTYTVTFRIAAVNVTKTVEVEPYEPETFENCIKTEEIEEHEGNIRRVVTWFAPQVGIVLSEEYANDTLSGQTELWSYNVQ